MKVIKVHMGQELKTATGTIIWMGGDRWAIAKDDGEIVDGYWLTKQAASFALKAKMEASA